MMLLFSINTSLWEKILPTIISGTIAIFLFFIGRLLDTFLKSKEQKRNWYLKVIIDPNIEKLNNFFSSSLIQFKSTLEELKNKSNIGHNDYLTLKTEEFGKFSSLKRDFEFEFINLIGINYSEIEQEIICLINNLDDNYKTSLDNIDNNTSEEILKKFEKQLYKCKTDLIAMLYKPLIYKKTTLWSSIKSLFS